MSDTPSTFAPKTPLQEFWFYFKQNRGALIGLIFILLVALISILAPYIAPFDPTEQNRTALLLPPAWYEGGNPAYLLGTDDIGRDILSRIIYGTRISVFAGFVIVLLSCAFGTSLGLISGYYGGVLDTIIIRLIDIMLAIPNLLLTIVVVSILEPSLANATLAIAVVSIPSYVRLTRAAVMNEKNRDYVTSSKVAGAGILRLMFIVILPNCLAPFNCANDNGHFQCNLRTCDTWFLRHWCKTANTRTWHNAFRSTWFYASGKLVSYNSRFSYFIFGACFQLNGRWLA